jgi:hypothetical protein
LNRITMTMLFKMISQWKRELCTSAVEFNKN